MKNLFNKLFATVLKELDKSGIDFEQLKVVVLEPEYDDEPTTIAICIDNLIDIYIDVEDKDDIFNPHKQWRIVRYGIQSHIENNKAKAEVVAEKEEECHEDYGVVLEESFEITREDGSMVQHCNGVTFLIHENGSILFNSEDPSYYEPLECREDEDFTNLSFEGIEYYLPNALALVNV